jgi:hypothetical protein
MVASYTDSYLFCAIVFILITIRVNFLEIVFDYLLSHLHGTILMCGWRSSILGCSLLLLCLFIIKLLIWSMGLGFFILLFFDFTVRFLISTFLVHTSLLHIVCVVFIRPVEGFFFHNILQLSIIISFSRVIFDKRIMCVIDDIFHI